MAFSYIRDKMQRDLKYARAVKQKVWNEVEIESETGERR